MEALEVTIKCGRHIWRGRKSKNGNTFKEVSTGELKGFILEERPQLYLGVASTEERTRVGIKDQDDRLQLPKE